MKTVKVGKLGSQIVELLLDDGATVGDAVSAAKVDTAGHSIRIGSAVVGLDRVPQDGDLIMVVPMIKGG